MNSKLEHSFALKVRHWWKMINHTSVVIMQWILVPRLTLHRSLLHWDRLLRKTVLKLFAFNIHNIPIHIAFYYYFRCIYIFRMLDTTFLCSEMVKIYSSMVLTKYICISQAKYLRNKIYRKKFMQANLVIYILLLLITTLRE